MVSIALILLPAGVGPPQQADMAGLFNEDDYPQAAAEANEQGETRVRTRVGADGMPTDCLVIKSSRSALLDSITCKIVLQRGRFIETAKLHEGKPFQIEMPVRWALAAPSAPVHALAQPLLMITAWMPVGLRLSTC